jgi:hypothetical protein
MTEWNDMLDQALRRYANPPQPDGLKAKILAGAEQKRRRRILLVFAPVATACAAAIVAAVMLLHETPLRPHTNATITVTNKNGAAGPAFAAKTEFSRTPHSRTIRRQADASAIAKSAAPVFPAPLPLTAEERRMQALAHDRTAIVPPEEPQLVISQLDIKPLEINNPFNQGDNNEQTQP